MGTNMENKPDIGFDKIIDALLDLNNTFPPKYLHRFSDISPMDLSSLQKVWNLIVASRKVTLLEDLEAISDSDTLTSFFDVGRLALTDNFAPVRELGIRLLWESEEHSLVKVFLKMLNNDPDINVQAAVASALGRFINLGELDVIPGEERDAIEQALIPKFDKSNPQLLRRRAIESLGYSSTPAIDKLIKKAYSESDKAMVASALFAMGRSANDAWAEIIISNLQNQNVREEILELLDDEGLDLDVFLAAIWSLSQIGGPGVQEKLEALAEDPDMDDETIELIESAAENLDFNNSLVNFNLLDISPEEDEDEEV
jgi:HEAT repeat protein